MEKSYFEMTEAEKTLTHLIDTVDYAGTIMAEGVVAEYEMLSTNEVIDMQHKVSEYLFKASQLMGELLSNVKVYDDEKLCEED